jgi:hypothetical protein
MSIRNGTELEANIVWRLMWQVTVWFAPPPLNRYQAVAAAMAVY